MTLVLQQKQEKKPNQDFPIVCAPCLGDNPFIKMIRYTMHEECKMCHRPFTVYQWKRDTGSRYMKTVICQVCSTLKNVCQSCLCDLDFGLPMYARDAIADEGKPKKLINAENPESIDVSKSNPVDVDAPQVVAPPKRSNVISLYHSVEAERAILEGGANTYKLAGERAPTAEQLVNKLRYHPYKDKSLKPPEDVTIKTLYISGVEPGRISQEELRVFFEAYGTIKSIKLMPKQAAAFVTYNNRSDAELAAESCHKVQIKQRVLKIQWAKPKEKKVAAPITNTTATTTQQPEEESMDLQTIIQHKQAIDSHLKDAGIKPPPFLIPPSGFYLAPPPGEEAELYPSMASLQGSAKQK